MKKNKLKQAVLSGLLVMSQISLASAEEKKIVLPSETRKILSEFESVEDREKLVKFLTPEVTAQIEAYADLDDQEVLSWSDPRAATPAAYAGAAAGGAAAAVVERLWDKYVGNGKLDLESLHETQFDFVPADREIPTPAVGGPLLKIGGVVVTGEKVVYGGPVRTFEKFNAPTLQLPETVQASVTEVIRQQQEYARFAARPETAQFGLAVGTAVAAAVGYKAAEWAMNKTGTALPSSFEVPETHFDLQQFVR